MKLFPKVRDLYARGGFRLVMDRSLSFLRQFDRNNYADWIRRYDTLTNDDRATMRACAERVSHKPLISVVMPTYNSRSAWLIDAIESVRKQIYPYWELCIADDASTTNTVRPLLERYAKADPRIKVKFRRQNGHISASCNTALELATGEWVLFLDHDDLLSEHALFFVADAIDKKPNTRLIYSDQDKSTSGVEDSTHISSASGTSIFFIRTIWSRTSVSIARMFWTT
jgi:GT2 family glycosyltransferase